MSIKVFKNARKLWGQRRQLILVPGMKYSQQEVKKEIESEVVVRDAKAGDEHGIGALVKYLPKAHGESVRKFNDDGNSIDFVQEISFRKISFQNLDKSCLTKIVTSSVSWFCNKLLNWEYCKIA